VVDVVADEAKDATKHKGKIGARRRAIKAGPANSNHGAETGLKEVNAAGSVLRGSVAKRRSKPRVVLRMANAPRELSVPNVENVRKEVLVRIGVSEPSAASGLSVVNVRSEANDPSGLLASAQSARAQRRLDRKRVAKAGAGAGVADAIAVGQIAADQIAVDLIGLKARDNQDHNRPGNPMRNRRKNSTG